MMGLLQASVELVTCRLELRTQNRGQETLLHLLLCLLMMLERDALV